MLDTALQLLIRLLQERQTNRQLVLSQCIEPLLLEVAALHKHRIDKLNGYVASLAQGVPPKKLILTDLGKDQDTAVSFRTAIQARAITLQDVAATRLDAVQPQIVGLMGSVADYLEAGSRVVPRGARIVARRPAEMMFVNGVVLASHIILKSADDIDLASRLLDRLLVSCHYRYTAVQHKAAEVRTTLLQ